jgi:hypothetical protein
LRLLFSNGQVLIIQKVINYLMRLFALAVIGNAQRAHSGSFLLLKLNLLVARTQCILEIKSLVLSHGGNNLRSFS